MSSGSILDLRCERHTLDNGLRVVLQRDPSIPLVAINLWYHVGSKNERPGRTGFAHLFEHMLFQGSEHVGTNDHFRYIQQVGGVANGSTWYDRTNYYVTLPAHQLDLGLWLESDRMGFLLPAITQEKLETQRQVVMNERRQRVENQPYGRSGETLHELLYPGEFPYHWPVIGYMEDIAAATLEDVREFFSTYYAPNNAVLTVLGDVDPDAALAHIQAYFDDIPAGPPLPRFVAPKLAPLVAEQRLDLEDDIRLPRVYLGFRAPAYGQPLWYAADLLSSVLTGGKSSLLYRDLVYDRQIAQDVAAYINPYEEVGTFVVVATARPGVAIETVEEAITTHLARLAQSPPNEELVEGARNRALTDHYGSLQKLETRADLLSQFATYFDDPEGVVREADRYRSLSAQDLTDFAAGFCRESQRVALRFMPRKPS